MRAARMAETNSGNGAQVKTDEVVLICTQAECEILYRALDHYLTAGHGGVPAAKMFHTFGWRPDEYLPPRRSNGKRPGSNPTPEEAGAVKPPPPPPPPPPPRSVRGDTPKPKAEDTKS